MRVLCCLLVLAGCGRASDGARAYRDGRFRDALAAYSQAERDAGAGASAELFFDESLAALRVGEASVADGAAERAARGGPEFAALAAFVRGNAAFGRAENAERQASGPEAEPFVFDVAAAYAESARRFWQTAATTRDDWPAARRNVERALALIGRLKSKKTQAETRRRPDARPLAAPAGDKTKRSDAPPADSGGGGDKGEAGRDAQAAAADGDLSAGDVGRLLELLADRDRRKLASRRGRREARTGDVEKDW